MQLDVLEGSANEHGLIVTDADLKVGRQGPLDLLKLGQHFIDHFDGVGARLLAEIHANGRDAVGPVRALDFLHAVLDAADVAEGNDRAVAPVREHDAIEVVDVLDAAHRSEGDFRRTGNEASARNFDVLPDDSITHLIDRESVCVEAVGIEQQLDFAFPLALEGDRADALQRLEVLLDLLVDDFRDLFLVARPIDGEHQNGLRIGVHFLDHRRLGVARELVDDGGDFVADVLSGRLDVALEREIDGDLGTAHVGIRPQLVNAADRVDGFFNPFGDLRLDLLGACAGQLDEHVDDGDVGLRHQIEAEVLVREHPQHDERRRHHHREDGTSHADVCKNHCRPPSPRLPP